MCPLDSSTTCQVAAGYNKEHDTTAATILSSNSPVNKQLFSSCSENCSDGAAPAPRIVSHFSCGAASAVATKLALADSDPSSFAILNAFLAKEHPDNDRFRHECEAWFGHPITVLRDTKYGADPMEVWRRSKFIKNRHFAICSLELKRAILNAACLPSDIFVLGYTSEEGDRLDNWYDANANRQAITPLIDRGLSKADCLAIVERAGIRLPAMYLLGFNNNNCIGCCKGGMGYWNRVRIHFPEIFEEACQVQDLLGESSYLFRNRETQERFGLRQLRPDQGRHDEPEISCSFFCEAVGREFSEVSS